MGYLITGRCFETQPGAEAFAYASTSPVVHVNGLSTVEMVSGVWRLREYQGGVLVSDVAAPALSFAPCSPGDLALDGAALAWLVLMAWAAAWGVSIMRRAL